MEVLHRRGCSSSPSNPQPHQSWVIESDDRLGGSRHDFESGFAENKSDDDEGFEIDASVIVSAHAITSSISETCKVKVDKILSALVFRYRKLRRCGKGG